MGFPNQPKARDRMYRATITPQGRQAALAGRVPGDCPYPPSATGKAKYWLTGWWEGENELARKENRPVRSFGGSITLIGDNIRRQLEFEK